MTTRIGKYEIIEELGRGAMGLVYKAYDSVLDRYVAVKTVLPTMEVDRQVIERFYREAQLAAKLRHRNIVTIYDFGEHDQHPYLVMEFVYGTDLQRIIERRLEFPLEKRINIALQICDGLGFAHSQGVIHRDIKPSNIRLHDDGKIQIMDFGVARPSGSTLTGTGQVVGAPAYMSPEQILGKQIDTRSDIFSLGIVLYEFFTYERPFPGESIHTIIYNIVNTEPRQISSRSLDLPAGLGTILLKALCKDPDQRYQKVEELAADLKTLSVPTGEETTSIIVGAGSATEQARLIEIQLNLGRKFLQTRDYDKCQELIEKVLKLQPGSPGALDLQARLAEAQKASQVEQCLETARVALARKDIQEAERAYQKALEIDPGNQAAAEMLRKMEVARSRRRVELLLQKARDLQQRGQLPEALKRVREALQVDPNHEDANALLDQIADAIEKSRLEGILSEAREALARSDFGMARQRFQSVLDQDAKNHPARAGMADVEAAEKQAQIDRIVREGREALGRSDLAAARRLFQSVLEQNPKEKAALAGLKEVEAAQKRAELEQIIREGRDRLTAQDWEGAQERFKAALELDPQHQPATKLLEEARAAATQEKERRERAELLVAEARAALDGDELESAAASLKELRAIAPAHPSLAQLDTVLEERRLAKAVEAEEPSFADEPEVDQVSESREPAPAAQAAPSIAETMLLPPSMPRPDPVQVHLGLAKEHLESGRYNEAAEAFARVLELNPGHAEAKAGLTEAESQRVSAQRGEFSSIPEMRFAEGRPARETAWWVSGWAYLSEELRASRKWLLAGGGAVILLGVGFLFYQMLGSAPATGIPPTSAAAPKLASGEPATGPDLEVVQQPDKTNTTATSGQPGAAKAPKAGSSPPSAAKSTEIPGKMVLLKPPQTGQDSAEIERLKRDYEARLKAMEGELKRQREVQTPGESESAANGGEPATAKKIEQKAGQKTEQTAEQKADQTAALPPAAAPPPATVPVEQPPPQPKVEAQVEEGNAVDIVPRPTARVAPSYPPAARRLKISGRVLVSVLVDERGEVIQAKVLRSDHKLLDSAALEAARKWKFIPASGNGRAVQAWYTLPEFEFRPN